jgi:serine beta-lactamase-like protein LACTB
VTSERETGRSKPRGLALIGGVLGVLSLAALGIYSVVTALTMTVHRDGRSVPSIEGVARFERWGAAVNKARQFARARIVEQNLPGLSVAVGVDGEIVWAEGLGWADLTRRVQVSPRTRFRIGHASKPVTSAAVGLLVEQGRLRLDNEIQTYVPAFPKHPWPITLRHVMANMSGIRHYRGKRDYMPSVHCERAAEGLPVFANDALRFEPETQYGYSTFGWVLVSAAVEAAAGEPFAAAMRNRIFAPLGMANTTFDSGPVPIPERATFYYGGINGSPGSGDAPETNVDYSCFAGAGGILSTPSDLVRFGNALLAGKLLQPATVTKLQSPQLLASGKETEYGLGWMLETAHLGGEPTLLAYHSSRTPLGGSASFLTFPERRIVVAVTTNIGGKNTTDIGMGIARTFAK